MSNQEQSAPTRDSKDRVLIQKLDDKTLQICEELKQTGKQLKESCFCASNSKRVNPKALIGRLEEFSSRVDSYKLKSDIQGIIKDIDKMYAGGGTRLFVRHANEEDGSKLELVCAVVYMYKIEGGDACGRCKNCKACKNIIPCETCPMCKACEEPIFCRQCDTCKSKKICKNPLPCGSCRACKRCRAPVSCGRCEECQKCESSVACDYLFTTYSYKEKINRGGLAVGIGMVTGGVLAGGLTFAACVASGGIGFLVLAATAAVVAGAGGGIGGAYIIYKSADTCINNDLQNLLEAAFVHELTQRAFAALDDGKLYLELKD